MSKRRVDPIDMLLSQAHLLEAESHANKKATESYNNEKIRIRQFMLLKSHQELQLAVPR